MTEPDQPEHFNNHVWQLKEYGERLGELEEELAAAQAQHVEELTQSQDDLVVAMKAVSNKEVEQLTAEVIKLKAQVDSERHRHMVSAYCSRLQYRYVLL